MNHAVDLTQSVARWKDYWAGTNREALIGYSYGNYFISRRFPSAETLLQKGKMITPEMAGAGHFLHDYDALFARHMETGADALFSAMPFPGIPWVEATAGCEVRAGTDSFQPLARPAEELFQPITAKGGAWAETYLASFDRLQKHAAGRYPVGQPIIRGPGDMLSAMFGGQTLILRMLEEPETVRARLSECTDLLIDLFSRQRARAGRYMDGYTLGFYQMWCPEFAVYFQDDVLALLSPKIQTEFLFEQHKKIADAFPLSLFHLHPNCLYALDRLMDIENLTVIQINKDVSGLNVFDMLPVFKDVLKKKKLHIWGNVTPEELETIQSQLPPNGLCVTVFDEKPAQTL